MSKKKSLAIILSVVMVLTMLPMTAFAAEPCYEKPPTLSKVKAQPMGIDSIRISWTDEYWEADGYAIYKLNDATGKYDLLKILDSEDDDDGYYVTSKGLKEGVKASYKVAAYTIDLRGNKYYGPQSADVSATPTFHTVPQNFRVSQAGSGKIALKWSKFKGAKGYQIYRWDSGKKAYKKVKTVTKTTFTDKGLKAGKKYTYKIRAYRSLKGKNDYSKYSAKKSTTAKLGTPKEVKASAKGTLAIKVSWDKVTGAKGYEIYSSTARDKKFKKLSDTKKTSYTNKKLKKGKTYYYKVRAYQTVKGKKIYSSYSAVKYAKPGYHPDFKAAIKTKPGKTKTITLEVKNNGIKAIYINKLAGLVSYDEEKDYAAKSKKGTTISAGKTKKIKFTLDKTITLKKTDYLYFQFEYNGRDYMGINSIRDGMEYIGY